MTFLLLLLLLTLALLMLSSVRVPQSLSTLLTRLSLGLLMDGAAASAAASPGHEEAPQQMTHQQKPLRQAQSFTVTVALLHKSVLLHLPLLHLLLPLLHLTLLQLLLCLLLVLDLLLLLLQHLRLLLELELHAAAALLTFAAAAAVENPTRGRLPFL